MNRTLNWLPTLTFACYGAVMLVGALSLGESFSGGYGHRTVPLTASLVLVGISVLILLKTLARGKDADDSDIEMSAFLLAVLPLTALLVLYAKMHGWFGYQAATLVCGVVAFRLFGNNWMRSVLHGLAGTAILYLVFFRLMKLYSPPGSVLDLSVPF